MSQHNHTLPDYPRTFDANSEQEASILPITNSLKSGRGIAISIGSRSKVEGRSNSRQHRKPIFSKEHNYMSSEGFRPSKPVQVLHCIETNQPSQNPLVRRFSSPSEPVAYQFQEDRESSQAKLYCNNILSLMKEQLDISVANTHAKMNEEIKKNNEQLIKLENKLRENEGELTKKDQEVAALKEMLDRMALNARCKDPRDMGVPGSDQFARNYEYLTSRLRDVEVKLRTASAEFESPRVKNEALCYQKLESKMDSVLSLVFGQYKNKVSHLFSKVESLNIPNESRLNSFETELNRLKQEMSQSSGMENRLGVMEQKLCQCRKQFQNTVRQVQAYSSKEFKYDNYQLKTLRARVEAIIQSITCFQGQKETINKYLEQISDQHNGLMSKIKLQLRTGVRNAEELVGSQPGKFREGRKQPQSSPNLNALSHSQSMKLKSTKSSYQNSLNETFTPMEEGDQYENFEDQNAEHSDEVMRRLIETIRKTRNPTPLGCQIDETGYLKYCKSGTYVFDLDGNLFQLTPGQIRTAIATRIITLS